VVGANVEVATTGGVTKAGAATLLCACVPAVAINFANWSGLGWLNGGTFGVNLSWAVGFLVGLSYEFTLELVLWLRLALKNSSFFSVISISESVLRACLSLQLLRLRLDLPRLPLPRGGGMGSLDCLLVEGAGS
jgi:hypothetical protein